MLNQYYADLHIHIGSDRNGKPVKISASRALTLENILVEATERKGLDLIGIVDCHVPAVQEEIERMIHDGLAFEHLDGGIQYKGLTFLLGSEIEIYDETCHGPIHVLCFFPTLKRMKHFTEWISHHMKNIHLSSQRFHGSATELQTFVHEHAGLFIPAHVFTPFKSLYGKGVKQSLSEVFNPEYIDAIELGLSADIAMADRVTELHSFSYVANSDAHSLQKIAREYQLIQMKEPTFLELKRVLHEDDGRKVLNYFGFHPALGKYSATYCRACEQYVAIKDSRCENCESRRVVKGVNERIDELARASAKNQLTRRRAPYTYQVPLESLPTLGKKTYEKLLDAFGTEMKVVHQASFEQLQSVTNEKIARFIINMRKGHFTLQSGGGGMYGKVSF
ncbi:MAG TPA: endonuclease Q family protein [Bacillota bacterium]|nr:endonuclease Q family protein [Bacillota bacterium]